MTSIRIDDSSIPDLAGKVAVVTGSEHPLELRLRVRVLTGQHSQAEPPALAMRRQIS